MAYTFGPMDEASAYTIFEWRYEPPYDFYNMGSVDLEHALQVFVDPQENYYRITDEAGNLVAFCCFGTDAQVPGGDYGQDTLDVGLGLRPDLTGQGHGLAHVQAVLDFARRTFAPITFRVTVAQFNKRALRVWQKAGFRKVQTFERNPDREIFVILTRSA